MYFIRSISSSPNDIHQIFLRWSPLRQTLFGALMASLAAILQAAGGLMPGIGMFLSPFTTLPILVSTLVSIRTGILTYILTILLLLLMEPSELFIFPFTTGLLGVGLGWTCRILHRRLEIILVNGLLLFTGICIPLYVLGFPVFGPAVTSSFNGLILVMIFGFSLLYCWLWLELGLFFLRKIEIILKSG
ncbi:hypothetical protein [Sporosarcina sp. 6E9]|uniref:hypothetical protein n=1 Tax=Sporosarcina sp. 6E9 TaxID=2819235 RepID=UPI001B31552F|nr:hypothetical protein [Sporosarcina sp. 6E9]